MNRKNTKKALVLSVLSLLLCVSMLVGTTFAWFTDSVSTGKNVIAAGNLDIELEYSKDFQNWSSVQGKTDLVDPNAKWEPGHTEVVYLRITNKGSLALKYNFSMNVVNAVVGKSVLGNDIALADYLKYDIVDVTAKYGSRKDARDAVEATAETLASYEVAGTMTAQNETKTLALVVYMPENIGDEANYRGTQPTIELGLELNATQLMNEKDSFGPDYDEDAIAVDILATPETIDEILATVEAGTAIGLAEGYYDEIVLTQDDLTLTSADGEAVVGFLNLNGKDNAVINGLTFDQTGAKQTYTFATGNVQTATTYVANITGDTNSPEAADGVVIKNCTFTNTSGVAPVATSDYAPIYFNEQGAATERCDSITVANCVFACNAKNYIVLNYLAEGAVVIKNNTFGSASFGTSHNTINATGNAANWTVTGNSFNNWNAEKTAIGSSKQGSGIVTWTVTGNAFNHADGAVILALKTSYNADNSVVTVANNTVWDGNGTIVSTPVNAENETVYAGHKIQLSQGVELVSSSEAFTEAVKNAGSDSVIILTDDVQTTGSVITTNGVTEAYGNKVGVAQYGGVVDGNGNTLTETTTNAYVIVTHGGTIKNLTIVGGGRGIVIYAPTEDVIIDNVLIDGPGYAINTAEHNGQDLIVTNSTVNGWTSLAGLDSVTFTNCVFGENTTKYWQNMGYDQDYDRLIKPYGQAALTNCTFEQGFYVDLSALDAGCTVTLTNCVCNGVVITAENYADHIFIELPSGRTLADCVVFN